MLFVYQDNGLGAVSESLGAGVALWYQLPNIIPLKSKCSLLACACWACREWTAVSQACLSCVFIRKSRPIEQQLMTQGSHAPPARNGLSVGLGLHGASTQRILHRIEFRQVKLQSAILRQCSGLSQHDNRVKNSDSAAGAFECSWRGSWRLKGLFCHHQGTKGRSLWIRAWIMNFKSSSMFAKQGGRWTCGAYGMAAKKGGKHLTLKHR